MKKIVLVLTLAFTTSVLLATAAEADRRGRSRHVLRGARHRRLGPPLAFRHHPRHLHSRRYGFHPHRYRPRRFRHYGYWSPFFAFGPSYYWGWRAHRHHHHHGVDCYERHDEPVDDGAPTFEFGLGWKLFGDGKPYDALRVFAQEATDDAKDGVAKVGVALAAADTGDLARGVWSMRRALRVDPEGLRYVPIDRRSAGRVRQLMVEYRKEQSAPEKRRDHAFMLAALHYLLDEDEAARDEVRLAIEYGDRSNSANNLSKILSGRG